MSSRPDILELKPSSLDIGEDDTGTTRNFSVIATSALNAKAKLAAIGISKGAAWSNHNGDYIDASVMVRSLSIEGHPEAPVGGTGDYLVAVDYSERGSQESAIGGPTIFKFSGSLTSVPVDHDRYGNPIITSTNEPVDPPMTINEPSEIMTAEWWWLNTSIDAVAQFMRKYRGYLNSSSWRGAPPRSVLCHTIDNTEQQDGTIGGMLNIKMVGRFEFRPPIPVQDLYAVVHFRQRGGTFGPGGGDISGFDQMNVDRGKRVEDGLDVFGFTQYKDILNADGKPVDEPVFLNGFGARLAAEQATYSPCVLADEAVARDFNSIVFP